MWLVRLTPPDTELVTPTLPLAQPVMLPVVTADGAYTLNGHVGMISQAVDSEIKATVGATTSAATHIDGSTADGGVRTHVDQEPTASHRAGRAPLCAHQSAWVGRFGRA